MGKRSLEITVIAAKGQYTRYKIFIPGLFAVKTQLEAFVKN